jgi:hypothetical protein
MTPLFLCTGCHFLEFLLQNFFNPLINSKIMCLSLPSTSTGVSNCDKHGKQKTSVMIETKWYKIQAKPKGCLQKIFQTLPTNFGKCLNKSCFKFHPFCMAWAGDSDRSLNSSARPETFRAKYLLCLLALSTNIRQEWKYLTVSKTLSYCDMAVLTAIGNTI